MFRTAARRAMSGRKPMIKFPDRSKIVHEPHTPHPHPAAPSEIAEKFESFQKTLESGPHFDANKLKDFKQLAAETAFPIGTDGPQGPVQTGALDAKQAQSSGNNIASGGSGPKAHTPTTRTDAADDLHDLPERFWRTPTLILEDTEMEAIMTGGANLVQ